MYRKLLLVALFLTGNLLLGSLYSCSVVDDGCNFTPVNDYCSDADRLSVDVYSAADFQPIAQGEAVKATELMMYVNMHGSRTVCYNQAQPLSNPFITSAYACSPPTPSYTLTDKVTGVYITADRDFNANYPQGSSLNDVFRMPLLSSINVTGTDAYDGSEQMIGQNYYYLDQKPEQAGDYTFTVTYTFESGKTLSISTAPITLSL